MTKFIKSKDLIKIAIISAGSALLPTNTPTPPLINIIGEDIKLVAHFQRQFR